MSSSAPTRTRAPRMAPSKPSQASTTLSGATSRSLPVSQFDKSSLGLKQHLGVSDSFRTDVTGRMLAWLRSNNVAADVQHLPDADVPSRFKGDDNEKMFGNMFMPRSRRWVDSAFVAYPEAKLLKNHYAQWEADRVVGARAVVIAGSALLVTAIAMRRIFGEPLVVIIEIMCLVALMALALLLYTSFIHEGHRFYPFLVRNGSFICAGLLCSALLLANVFNLFTCRAFPGQESSCGALKLGIEPPTSITFFMMVPHVAQRAFHLSWFSCTMLAAITTIGCVVASASYLSLARLIWVGMELGVNVIMVMLMSQRWQYDSRQRYLSAALTHRMARTLRAEKLRRAKAQALKEAYSRTITFASHELRNPLHVAMGTFETCAAEDMDDEATEEFVALGQQLVSIAGLLNDMTNVDLLAEGKLNVRNAMVDVHSLVEDTCEQFRPYTLATVSSTVRHDVPKTITTDAVRLRQLLHAGLTMAVAAADGGTIMVTAELTKSLNAREVPGMAWLATPQPRSDFTFAHSTVFNDTDSRMRSQSNAGDSRAEPADPHAQFLRITVCDTGNEDEARAGQLTTTPSSTSVGGNSLRAAQRGNGITMPLCKRVASMMGGDAGLSKTRHGHVVYWFGIPVEVTSLLEHAIEPPPGVTRSERHGSQRTLPSTSSWSTGNGGATPGLVTGDFVVAPASSPGASAHSGASSRRTGPLQSSPTSSPAGSVAGSTTRTSRGGVTIQSRATGGGVVLPGALAQSMPGMDSAMHHAAGSSFAASASLRAPGEELSSAGAAGGGAQAADSTGDVPPEPSESSAAASALQSASATFAVPAAKSGATELEPELGPDDLPAGVGVAAAAAAANSAMSTVSSAGATAGAGAGAGAGVGTMGGSVRRDARHRLQQGDSSMTLSAENLLASVTPLGSAKALPSLSRNGASGNGGGGSGGRRSPTALSQLGLHPGSEVMAGAGMGAGAGIAAGIGSVYQGRDSAVPLVAAAGTPARPRKSRSHSNARGRPRTSERTNATPSAVEVVTGSYPSIQKCHALWVDDIRMNRVLGQRMLESMGHDCDLASDGDESLRILLHGVKRYDIVFMDIVMQRVNGDEAVKELRKAGCTTPIVAATGNASPEDWVYYMERCGFNAVLSKPFTRASLGRVLKALMSDAQPDPLLQ